MMYEMHPIEVRGQKFPVRADANGTFMATAGGTTLHSPTYAGLRDKLLNLTAKAQVRLSVPFVLINAGPTGDGHVSGIVTGIHGGNGNLLVTWTGGNRKGQKDQWTPGYSDVVFSEASAEEVARYRELRRRKAEADAVLFRFTEDRKIDLQAVVKAAVEEAVKDNAGN